MKRVPQLKTWSVMSHFSKSLFPKNKKISSLVHVYEISLNVLFEHLIHFANPLSKELQDFFNGKLGVQCHAKFFNYPSQIS